ncbi:MFS general substrate transporter [Tothia fuscella]|uniref:MFS general substrate transporter n=1 Tax=Tothia fuscella TaxID=1048955 RepID=A0A9P4NIE3_9PEZI|nr:MFS general substrate transporter [Tothia fuscella]
MATQIETSSYELESSHDLSSRTLQQTISAQPIPTEHLKPIDRGYAAWRLLATAFVFESLLWGFPLSFGVFQNYYSKLPQFANNPYIPIVGTIASGISYLGAPVITPFIKRYPKYLHQMIWVGWPFCIAGLAAGSFANTLGGLIITQGIMYGVGFVIFYYPILSFVNEFWIERRGMAYGLLCSASGVSGVVMPFILSKMLNRYGYPMTLRAIAVALAVLTGPLIPALKGRLPSTSHGTVGRTDWGFLKSPVFWVYSASNFIQGLGYFFPSLYLPSYATSIGLSDTQGALLLAMLSIFQVLGQFSFGYFSDRRVKLDFLILASTLISGVACFSLWFTAHSLATLVVFSVFYGFFGAGYVAMWARMGSAVSEEPTASLAIFGWFCAGKGVGNVSAGPLSAALVSHNFIAGDHSGAEYRAVIIFTGVCMFCSGAIVAGWHIWSKISKPQGEEVEAAGATG